MSLLQTLTVLLIQLYTFTTFVSIVSFMTSISTTTFAKVLNIIDIDIDLTKTTPKLRSRFFKTSTLFQDAGKSVAMPMAVVPGILEVDGSGAFPQCTLM